MKRIYKYTLQHETYQKLRLPADAKIISAIEQRGEIVLYAIVDTHVLGIKATEWMIAIIGTGHDIGKDIEDYTFLNTVKLEEGKFMYHVFYK